MGTWCSKAAFWTGCSGAALLGDALHAFPPDLGIGVNAGLWDVLQLMELLSTTVDPNWQRILEAYEASQAPEAEAVCQLIPDGVPYQYGQPLSFAQVRFVLHMVVRFLFSRACPCLIDAPVVALTTMRDPPLKF